MRSKTTAGLKSVLSGQALDDFATLCGRISGLLH